MPEAGFASCVLEKGIMAEKPIFSEDRRDFLFEKYDDYRSVKACVLSSATVKGELSLTAIDEIEKGEVVFVYHGDATKKRTRTSIQIGKNIHLEAGSFASFTNHSCEPNAHVVTACSWDGKHGAVLCYAGRDIVEGEEICFDYASTETELTLALATADCLCNSGNCRGRVKGFSDLTFAERKTVLVNRYKNRHILDIINKNAPLTIQ